jgi:predicted amidohydrolase
VDADTIVSTDERLGRYQKRRPFSLGGESRKPDVGAGRQSLRSRPQFAYPGCSVVVDPHGVIIADAADREGLLTATCDPAVAQH